MYGAPLYGEKGKHHRVVRVDDGFFGLGRFEKVCVGE